MNVQDHVLDMTYLHCRIRTRIQTPEQMATLHYTDVFTLCGIRCGFNPNCQLQEWKGNPSPYPSPSPTM